MDDVKDFSYYDINGKHAKLGKQIPDQEFKGYVVAKLEELASLRIKVDANQRILYLGIGGLTVLIIVLRVFF